MRQPGRRNGAGLHSAILIGVDLLAGVVVGWTARPFKKTSGASAVSSPSRDFSEVREDVRRLVNSGNKIEAIKLYRELYSTELKTAKEAIERYSRS